MKPKKKSYRELRWSPPEDGWIKIKIDASRRYSSGLIIIGYIMRDNRAKSSWLPTWFLDIMCHKNHIIHNLYTIVTYYDSIKGIAINVYFYEHYAVRCLVFLMPPIMMF